MSRERFTNGEVVIERKSAMSRVNPEKANFLVYAKAMAKAREFESFVNASWPPNLHDAAHTQVAIACEMLDFLAQHDDRYITIAGLLANALRDMPVVGAPDKFRK